MRHLLAGILALLLSVAFAADGPGDDPMDLIIAQKTLTRALDSSPPGTPLSWSNPGSGTSGSVVVLRDYARQGQRCRDYRRQIRTADGTSQVMLGASCRNSQGRWEGRETSEPESREQRVADCQVYLQQLGYKPGRPDGKPGTRTRLAVRAYQSDAGLPVDGRITEDLRIHLATRVNPPKTAAPTKAAESFTPKPEQKKSGGFFSGFKNLSRGVSGLFGGGARNDSSGTGGTTATIGIRGLQADDVIAARPDPAALSRMQRYRVSSQEATGFARQAGLTATNMAYLTAPRPHTATGGESRSPLDYDF